MISFDTIVKSTAYPPFLIIADCFFSQAAIFLTNLLPHIPNCQYLRVYGVLLILFTLLRAKSKGVDLHLRNPYAFRLMMFRSLTGSCAYIIFLGAGRLISISDLTPLCFLSPIFVGIASALFLGKPFTLELGICSLCCFGGVIAITKPPFLWRLLGTDSLPPLTVAEIFGYSLAILHSVFLSLIHI
eukprot:TRINITY_DN7590_c0_g1_i2.p1 TRINITY_DN7590_c0_g1~~TRINITY_DN7590_c0_g1_i2.p1  ORF type:complete len:186 (-),score=13.34 TRINITY_DN7590_c0_g1_i2:59-616(-)